jgi:hypothetical protein
VQTAELHVEPVTRDQARIARDAYRDFGKGSGHKAGLDFGDCFAYAVAKTTGQALLFKAPRMTIRAYPSPGGAGRRRKGDALSALMGDRRAARDAVTGAGLTGDLAGRTVVRLPDQVRRLGSDSSRLRRSS